MLLNCLQIFGFLLLSGFVLPITKNRTNADFLVAFWCQALWVCMLVGYIRFLTGISAELFLIAFLPIVGLRIFYKPLQPVVISSANWRWPLVLGGGYLVFLAVLGPVAVSKGVYTEFVPRAAFMGWDGILSFNRWALEFTRFEYWPYEAYYPTGFPAAWSVLYDLQDNSDIWVFPALLMFSLLLFPILALGCFIADRRWAVAFFFASAISIIALKWANRITNGYMDAPVSLLLFLGLFWTFLAFDKEKPLDIRRLTTGFFLLSVAAVTKQPGLVGLTFGIALLMLLVIRQAINHRSAAYLLAVLLIPSLFSGGIFYASGNHPLGNFQALRELSNESNGSIAVSLSYLISYGSLPVFGALIATCIWSIARGGQSGVFSLVCVIIAAVGFIAYHDCCSYSDRNAVWIYSFLFAAAAPISTYWRSCNKPEKKAVLPSNRAISGSVGITLCIAITVTAFNAFVPIQQAEAYFRDRIGGFQMHQMLGRNMEGIKENGLFSFFKPLSFSTLVGPYHAVLQNRGAEGLSVAEINAAEYNIFCETLPSGTGCPLSAVLKDKPCARIMLRYGDYKHISRDDRLLSVYEEYALVPLDAAQQNNFNYELFVSSRTCSQPWI